MVGVARKDGCGRRMSLEACCHWLVRVVSISDGRYSEKRSMVVNIAVDVVHVAKDYMFVKEAATMYKGQGASWERSAAIISVLGTTTCIPRQ
jgi:hypothetical protein